MKKMMLAMLVVAAMGVAIVAQQRGGGAQPGVQGAWSIAAVTTTGPNGTTNKSPQPSLYIFTGRHYSLIRVNGTQARPVVQDVDKATAEQLQSIYGAPLTAQSGTYEVAGGKLTMRPMVAKNPAAMAAGTFNTFALKVDGSTLTLVSESTNTGPVANPTTWTLRRVE